MSTEDDITEDTWRERQYKRDKSYARKLAQGFGIIQADQYEEESDEPGVEPLK